MTNSRIKQKNKWMVVLLCAAAALLLWAGLNLLTDPFGVFGDPLMDWYGYNETLAPGVAKIAWLERHPGEYDSYLLGASSAGAYDVETLNTCLNGDFYNLSTYGNDSSTYRALAAYLLENHPVRQLVLQLDPVKSDAEDLLHSAVSGEWLPGFYGKYLFKNPKYAVEKLAARQQDTEFSQAFDRFDPLTGSYDDRVRNIEPIGDLEVYLAAHGEAFSAVPQELVDISAYAADVAAIRELCAQKGAVLTVILPPVYAGAFDRQALLDWQAALAAQVDYWDFSLSSLSADPRYFYDAAHFRTAVGDLMLARISGGESLSCPEDFGRFVTAETAAAHLSALSSPALTPEDPVEVPVLMYHHFAPQVTAGTIVTPERFEEQIRALAEAGYTAVTFDQMIDYVCHGGTLPEKPVCITIDDGYLSNYEVAWPVLEKYGMKATIFAIGCSVGHKEYYKDTTHAMTPHFSYEEAAEMMASGVIDVQTHTYDMHQWPPFETGDNIRSSMLPFEGETFEEYAAVLANDLETYRSLRQAHLSGDFIALAYPGGFYSDVTEVLLHEAGIPVTVTVEYDTPNVLVPGLPQSLYALSRLNVTQDFTGESLVAELEKE